MVNPCLGLLSACCSHATALTRLISSPLVLSVPFPRPRLTSISTYDSRSHQPMTEKVDIFSMGFVYYWILAGGLPFGSTNDSRNAFMETTGGISNFEPSWHPGFVEVSHV